MFFYKIIKIIGTGSNAKVYSIKLCEENKSDSGVANKVMNVYDHRRLEPTDKISLILKKGTMDKAEIDFLKFFFKPENESLRLESINFINHMIAEAIFDQGIFESDTGLIFEEANCDLNKMFEDCNSLLDVAILKRLAIFFNKVLIFFEKIKIVYGDWKLENILVFYKEREMPRFKLTDFGSIMKVDEQILNENKINFQYKSPNFYSKRFTPTIYDDFKSVCYIFWTLNGLQLPWEFCSSNCYEEDLKDVILHTQFKKYLNQLNGLDISKCKFWPSKEFFEKERETIQKYFECEFYWFNFLNVY